MMLAVTGIAIEDGQLLLVRDLQGFWSGVEGWIESRESPEEALLREVREELGVDAKITCIFRPVIIWNVNGTDNFLLFVYGMSLLSHDFTPQASEITGVTWAKPEDLGQLDMLPWIRAIFNQCLEEWLVGMS